MDKISEELEQLLNRTRAEDLSVIDWYVLIRKYLELKSEMREIQEKLKFTYKNIEVKIQKDGVVIKTVSEILLPFEIFDEIIKWYQEVKKES